MFLDSRCGCIATKVVKSRGGAQLDSKRIRSVQLRNHIAIFLIERTGFLEIYVLIPGIAVIRVLKVSCRQIIIVFDPFLRNICTFLVIDSRTAVGNSTGSKIETKRGIGVEVGASAVKKHTCSSPE